MAKRKVVKRVKMSKFERLIYTFALVLAVSAPLTIVFSKATLSKINFEVEKTKKEISEQSKTNESLSMKINELASLGYELEITNNMAFIYEYETSNSKYNFPNNKKISDIVLMVNTKLYSMITNKEIPLDDKEIGHITRESLEVILKDIKNNYKDYLSKQYQDLSLEKFFLEVTNYMIEYSFLKEEDNTYLVLPTIGRFNAKLERSNTKQMDLFGGDDDV